MRTHLLHHREQLFCYTEHELAFPRHATEMLLRILGEWQNIYPHEDTLIFRRSGVPSLFVRFDCVIDADGALRFYELQEGCAWIGYTGVVNRHFREIRDKEVALFWPGLASIMTGQDPNTDDELWLPRINPVDAMHSERPLMIRSQLLKRTETEREFLIRRSVRPVRTHNDKEYGIAFGWWKPVRWDDTEEGNALPWDTSFVLKPVKGHGSKDIVIWKVDDRAGRSTRTQILQALRANERMLLQPFHPPMRLTLDRDYHMIYRPYFIYSVEQRAWIPAHGVWTARPAPSLRIHGASDAVSGPLMME